MKEFKTTETQSAAKLIEMTLTTTHLYLRFSDNHKLELVRASYERFVADVMKSAQNLMGQRIRIITSQYNAPWSSLQYFCAIKPL